MLPGKKDGVTNPQFGLNLNDNEAIDDPLATI
jgi:hypothetical protein